jgi:hypothetical protein
MRLTSIEITDLAGFSGTIRFPLHAVSLIQGDHGKGKSSIMSVVEYAFGRRPLADVGARGIAHDPSIIHGACEKGEAVITFDDESSYRVTVNAENTYRWVRVPNGKKWDKATPETIDGLVNALSYDPFTFKDLDEKKRVETLLKASPVEVSYGDMTAALGDLPITLPSRALGLQDVNAAYSALYDQRRDANSRADVQGKHAEELEKAVGDSEPAPDVSALRAEKDEMERGERELIEKLRKLVDGEKQEQGAAHVARKAAIDSDINSKIAALGAERLSRITDSQSTATALIDDARNQANAAVANKRAELAPRLEALTAEIATTEERASRVAKQEGTRDAAKLARAAEATSKADSQRIDAAMGRLGALKESTASKLAIPGITIASPRKDAPVDICRQEGDALVPFSRWNEADKERFCLRIAVLFHGKCGVVFVDEIGHFTDERRAALIAAARKYALSEGMQFIFGMSTPEGGALRVVEG